MRLKKLIYLYALLFFFSPLFAKEYYTIGVEHIDYYPYYSINNNGEYIGFARDVLDLFAKNKNFKFIYEVRPIKKLDQEYFDERRFDFRFPDNKFWRVDSKKGFEIFYSDPVCNFIDGVIVLEQNKEKDLNFFKSLGIGAVRGYVILGYENTGVPISESPNIETLIEKLKFNKISGAYFNISVALNRINLLQNQKIKFAFDQKIPYYKSSFYLSSFEHSNLIYEFNRFLNEKRDEINDLKLKYGITD